MADLASQQFYKLTVKAVREETKDAQSFILVPDRQDAKLFAYQSGQFLTFQIPHESGDIKRSYSLSSARSMEPDMMVCVKRVEGGKGSNWFNDKLQVGARVFAAPPSGRFIIRDPQMEAPLLFFAGGSGITPCISLIKQQLMEGKNRIKLIYANRDIESVIYKETLEMLAERFGDRFECQHHFDDENGFLCQDGVCAQIKGWEDAVSYICGPAPMMDMVENCLSENLGDEAKIYTERFVSPDDDVETLPNKQKDETKPRGKIIAHFDLQLDGEVHKVALAEGETLMEAAMAANIDAPASCLEGHCGTCMAALENGAVDMASTQALSKRNIERGLILLCQAKPKGDNPISVNFDL